MASQSLQLVRLGLLLYLGSVLNEYPPEISVVDMLGVTLRTALQRLSSFNILDALPPHFRLWLTFLAGTRMANLITKMWYADYSTQILRSQGWGQRPAWEQVRKMVSVFFWIDDVHELEFRRFFEGVVHTWGDK